MNILDPFLRTATPSFPRSWPRPWPPKQCSTRNSQSCQHQGQFHRCVGIATKEVQHEMLEDLRNEPRGTQNRGGMGMVNLRKGLVETRLPEVKQSNGVGSVIRLKARLVEEITEVLLGVLWRRTGFIQRFCRTKGMRDAGFTPDLHVPASSARRTRLGPARSHPGARTVSGSS